MDMMKNSLTKIALIGIAGIFLIGGMTLFLAVRLQKVSVNLQKKDILLKEIEKERIDLKENYDKIHTDYTALVDESAQMKDEVSQLKDKLDTVARDRDNLLLQVKKSLAEKERLRALETSLGETEEKLLLLEQEKEKALNEAVVLQKQIEGLLSKKDQSDMAYQQLVDEKKEILAALTELREETGVQQIVEEKSQLAQQKNMLQQELEQLTGQITSFREKENVLVNQIKELGSELSYLRSQYSEAVKRNEGFEKKWYEAPAEFAELARQNKLLIERTASMHYNLGVFYVKEKEYERALKELQKALELKPDDPHVHFNMGYIYAEHMIDRAKAVEHFEQYLKFVGKEEEEVDWVRNYIITWKMWSGEEAMK